MNTTFLYAASAVSVVAFLAHVFIGNAKNAAPVFSAKSLPNGPKTTVFFAWQAASVLMLFMALGYAWAAFANSGKALVVFITVLCATLCIVGGIIAARGSIQFWTFPPSVLFAVISVLGTLAFVV